MGAYPNTYLGIYLVIPHVIKTTFKTIIVSPSTGKEMKSLFDPHTGEKGEEKTITVTSPKAANGYDILTELGYDESHFWSPEYTVNRNNKETWLLNNYGKYHFKIPNDGENCFNIDFSDFNGDEIVSLLEDFKMEYLGLLEYLNREFGYIEVKYGIVHYYH